MDCLPEYPSEYFEQFRTTPLLLHPFDPYTKVIAKKQIKALEKGINDPEIEIALRGSTLLEIVGKGDIDIAIYSTPESWAKTSEKLKQLLGDPSAQSEDFQAFNTTDGKYMIEISLMKGQQVTVDKALTEFLVKNEEAKERYVELKKIYSYSKREYIWQRYKFFNEIISRL